MTKRISAVRRMLNRVHRRRGTVPPKPDPPDPPLKRKGGAKSLGYLKHPFFGGCPRCRHLRWCAANRHCDRLPCELGKLPIQEEEEAL